MGRMKDHMLGVCYRHPKEMYDLYDLLCGSEYAARAVEVALIECNGGDSYPSPEVSEIMSAIDDILADVPEEDCIVMLGAVSLVADKESFMAAEQRYWKSVLAFNQCLYPSREVS